MGMGLPVWCSFRTTHSRHLTPVHACSDDQLLNEDSGWGAYLEGRQRHGARGAAIPRLADPADLPSSYAESWTSPTQPSPQVRCTSSLALIRVQIGE